MKPSRIARELAADLAPVRPPPRLGPAIALWLVASWTFVLLGLAATGPFRPDFTTDLAGSPRFVLECALGVAASAMAVATALSLSIPGVIVRGRLLATVGLGLAWLLLHAVGLESPALAPSMVGKRELCFYETLVFALPPLALAVYAIRRRYPLRRGIAAGLAGIAGAAIPAVAMQIACMYEPWHVLTHHLLPVALVGGASAAFFAVLFRRP